MRLAAQAKGGFYPCAPEAVRWAAGFLLPPDQSYAVLDPCCGQGRALADLSLHLSFAAPIRPEWFWAIELDEGRALVAKETLTGANVLAPASFLGVQASPNSFSAVWLNPPFDDELSAGGRVEYTFLVRATQMLKPGGVMLFVCPEHTIDRWDTRQYLLQWYTDIASAPFPEEHRPYNETLTIGRKRHKPVDADALSWDAEVKPLVLERYALPPAAGPKVWKKVEFTDQELARALLDSPLRKMLEPPAELALVEPPLPLARGHIALLLASGKLDGVVEPKGEPPHVVRGSARKEQYLSSQTEEEGADGGRVKKTVYSEKIVLTIRALSLDGAIKTFE